MKMKISDNLRIAYFPLSVFLTFIVATVPCASIFLWTYGRLGGLVIWFIVPLLVLLYVLFLVICLAMFSQIRKFYKMLPDGVYKKGDVSGKLNELRMYYYSLFLKLLGPFTDIERFNQLHRLFGAKVGKGTLIGGSLVEQERIEIGKNCFIGSQAAILAHAYEGDNHTLKKVKVGDNVTIGGHSIIFPGVEIGDNVIIGANTVIPANRKIPSNSVWIGAKPQRIK
jgi:acetyltransferase-like isoleucine patch superfamily enzyme